MRRRQLVEIEDLAWCPRAVRDGGTDWLGFMANATKVFSAVVPKIRVAMDATGTSNVVDLCSGGGGPWLTLEPELAKSGPVNVELSDLYPNILGYRLDVVPWDADRPYSSRRGPEAIPISSSPRRGVKACPAS